eukprot:5439960-Prymnesium_polylepis.1
MSRRGRRRRAWAPRQSRGRRSTRRPCAPEARRTSRTAAASSAGAPWPRAQTSCATRAHRTGPRSAKSEERSPPSWRPYRPLPPPVCAGPFPATRPPRLRGGVGGAL